MFRKALGRLIRFGQGPRPRVSTHRGPSHLVIEVANFDVNSDIEILLTDSGGSVEFARFNGARNGASCQCPLDTLPSGRLKVVARGLHRDKPATASQIVDV